MVENGGGKSRTNPENMKKGRQMRKKGSEYRNRKEAIQAQRLMSGSKAEVLVVWCQ